MKKITKSLLITGVIFSANNAYAMLDDISISLGGGYEWIKMGHGEGFGLPKSYHGGNFFVGGRWCNVGIEGGYDFAKKNKSISPTPIQNSFTVPLGIGVQSETITTKINTNFSGGWHLDLNGYLPVCDCFELIASLGCGRMEASIKGNVQTVHVLTSTNSRFNISNTTINGVFVTGNQDVTTSFVKQTNKTVLRLGAGAQYMIFDNIGLRGIFRWKNTSKLKTTVTKDRGLNTTRYTITPKDSISLEAGIFFKF